MAADNGGGGGYSAPTAVPPAQAQTQVQQPSQGGQQPQWNPGANRGRTSDFGSWGNVAQGSTSQQQQPMGADGIPGQPIALSDQQLSGLDPNDPFSPLSGTDAQSQALTVQDGQQRDQQSGMQTDADDSVQAQVMSEADVRALIEEYRAWRDGDDLAGPLMQKFVPVTLDGKRYRIPVEEAAKGYQRNQDYSNKLREVYTLKQQVEQREAGLQRLMADLSRDGQSFYDTIEAFGLFKQFGDAAMILGTQLAAERAMDPAAREQAKALREMRMQAKQLAQNNARLQAQLQAQQAQRAQQPGQPDQADMIRMQQVAHLLPSVAQRAGLVQTPFAMGEFERHFANMLPSLNGGDITTEFLETVVGATMESIAAQVSAHKSWQEAPEPVSPYARDATGRFAGQGRAAPQQRVPAQVPPAGRMTGPATAAPQNGRQQRMRIGDFDRGVRGRM